MPPSQKNPDATHFDQGLLRSAPKASPASASVHPTPTPLGSALGAPLRSLMEARYRLSWTAAALWAVAIGCSLDRPTLMAALALIGIALGLMLHVEYRQLEHVWLVDSAAHDQERALRRHLQDRLAETQYALFLQIERAGRVVYESVERLPFLDVPPERLFYLVFRTRHGQARLCALERRTLGCFSYEGDDGRTVNGYFPREEGNFANGELRGYRTDDLLVAVEELNKMLSEERSTPLQSGFTSKQ